MRLKDKSYYTTEEQSLKLKNIIPRTNADAFWYKGELCEHGLTPDDDIPAFRNDTLLLALPEWCFEYSTLCQSVCFKFDIPTNIDVASYDHLRTQLAGSRAPQAITVAVDLICLLKEIKDNAQL